MGEASAIAKNAAQSLRTCGFVEESVIPDPVDSFRFNRSTPAIGVFREQHAELL
jgi:hypothetical protein